NDIVLPAITHQQNLKSSKQSHKECGAFSYTECPQVLTEFGRKCKDGRSAAITFQRRARKVGRQFQQGGGASKMLTPVAQKLLQGFSLQPPTLPEGIIGILHRQLRQS